MRSTIRLGSKGPDVIAWQQKALGFTSAAAADGDFGPVTDRATKTLQERSGLVPDGVVGARSWALIGEKVAVPVTRIGGGYPGNSPACTAALRDANARWPTRKKASDGIPGDLAHQFKPGPDGKLGTADDVPNVSDHNLGNAVDITSDKISGCTGDVIRTLALKDPRTQYVISNGLIYNVDINGGAARPYKGANKHDHHCHISVKASMRNDGGPWPWGAG